MQKRNRFFALIGTLVATAALPGAADATSCSTCRDITSAVTARWVNSFNCKTGTLDNPGIPSCITEEEGEDGDSQQTFWHDDMAHNFCQDSDTVIPGTSKSIDELRSCGANNNQGCNGICENIVFYGTQYCDAFMRDCISGGTVGNVNCPNIRTLRSKYVSAYQNANLSYDDQQTWCNGMYEESADQSACLTCLTASGGDETGGSGSAFSCNDIRAIWADAGCSDVNCTIGGSGITLSQKCAELYSSSPEQQAACYRCIEEAGSGAGGSGGGGGGTVLPIDCGCTAGTYYNLDSCGLSGCTPCPAGTYCDNSKGCNNNCQACPQDYSPSPILSSPAPSISYSSTTTSIGSTSITQCYVKNGSYWYGSNAAGTYKRTISPDCHYSTSANGNTYE